MIRVIIVIASIVLMLIAVSYTTFAYAQNTRYRNSDLMGAAINFDLMWLITTIPATVTIMLLFNFFWLWAFAIFLVWYIGVGMSYKLLLSHLLDFIRSTRMNDDEARLSNKHRGK